jgi:hypothetical protein
MVDHSDMIEFIADTFTYEPNKEGILDCMDMCYGDLQDSLRYIFNAIVRNNMEYKNICIGFNHAQAEFFCQCILDKYGEGGELFVAPRVHANKMSAKPASIIIEGFGIQLDSLTYSCVGKPKLFVDGRLIA